MERRWFLVSGEQGIPAGGAGEHPKLLLDGEDHDEGGSGVSVHLWRYREGERVCHGAVLRQFGRSSWGRCMPPRWVFICTLRSAGTRWSGQWTALRAAFSGGRLPWGGQWERIWFYTLLFMVAGHSVHLCILHFIGWHQEADNYRSAMTLLRQQPACRGSDLYYVICPEFCRLLRIY